MTTGLQDLRQCILDLKATRKDNYHHHRHHHHNYQRLHDHRHPSVDTATGLKALGQCRFNSAGSRLDRFFSQQHFKFTLTAEGVRGLLMLYLMVINENDEMADV